MPATPLLRSRIFDGLTDAEREHWLSRARTAAFKRGHVLARQGDPARSFYLLESGFLKILQLTAEGTEVIVRFIAPGEPFGGVVALGDAPYPVTAIVAQPSTLRCWTREVVAELLGQTPQVRVNLMREMALHMTDALTRVRELTSARVGQRLAHALLRLSRQCGQPDPAGVLIAQPLTRQELADLTGATLYTVSRTLARWEADGILESRQRRLLLKSLKQLEQIAVTDDD
ncbi:MAG TPA: Crp/Fnr family transcriptional regulator [Conexibacter sp.]|nr:Crp/Fnr family transcriptional regulator [Conexibacter sp.]